MITSLKKSLAMYPISVSNSNTNTYLSVSIFKLDAKTAGLNFTTLNTKSRILKYVRRADIGKPGADVAWSLRTHNCAKTQLEDVHLNLWRNALRSYHGMEECDASGGGSKQNKHTKKVRNKNWLLERRLALIPLLEMWSIFVIFLSTFV